MFEAWKRFDSRNALVRPPLLAELVARQCWLNANHHHSLLHPAHHTEQKLTILTFAFDSVTVELFWLYCRNLLPTIAASTILQITIGRKLLFLQLHYCDHWTIALGGVVSNSWPLLVALERHFKWEDFKKCPKVSIEMCNSPPQMMGIILCQYCAESKTVIVICVQNHNITTAPLQSSPPP